MLIHELIVRIMLWCRKDVIFKFLPLRGKLLYHSSDMLREHEIIANEIIRGRSEIPFFNPYDLFDCSMFMMKTSRFREIQESINFTPDIVDRLKCLKNCPEILVDTRTWEIITEMDYDTTLLRNIKYSTIMLRFITELLFKDNTIFINNYQQIRKKMIGIIGITIKDDVFKILDNSMSISEKKKLKIINKAIAAKGAQIIKKRLKITPTSEKRIFELIQHNDTDLAIHYWIPEKFPVSSNMVLQLTKMNCDEYTNMMHNSVEREVSFYKKIIYDFLDSIFDATKMDQTARLKMYMLSNQLVDFVSILFIP